jgi:hypothetical protein
MSTSAGTIRPRRVGLLAMALSICVTMSGCGLRDPYNDPTASSHSPAAPATAAVTAPVAPAVAPSSQVHAASGSGASAAEIISRFALAYANFSVATVAARQRKLIALSTAAFARVLRLRDRRATLDAARAMPPGARMTGTLSALQLTNQPGGGATASLTIGEGLRLANGAAEQPLAEAYTAQLTDTPDGWRVAAFTPAP